MNKKNLKVFSLASSIILLVCTTIATCFAFAYSSFPMSVMCAAMSIILSLMAYGDFKELKDLEKEHG